MLKNLTTWFTDDDPSEQHVFHSKDLFIIDIDTPILRENVEKNHGLLVTMIEFQINQTLTN